MYKGCSNNSSIRLFANASSSGTIMTRTCPFRRPRYFSGISIVPLSTLALNWIDIAPQFLWAFLQSKLLRSLGQVRSSTNSQALSSFSLVKRQRHNLRSNHSTAHVDFDCAPFVCKLDRNVSHADVSFQKWRGASRCNSTHALAIDQNVLAISRDAAISYFKTDQLTSNAFFFLRQQSIAADEVTLVQFSNPAQVCFQQRRRLVNLVAV